MITFLMSSNTACMGTHVQLDDVFCFTNFLSGFLFRVRVRVRARGGFRVRVRVRTSIGG